MTTKGFHLAAAAALALSCGGGGGSDTGAAPSGAAGASSATVRITSSGVTPKEVQVGAGGRVTFVNEAGQAHEMMSDPHPVHDACPEINQVGVLAPGQSRQTGAFSGDRACGFHDNRQDSVAALRGVIMVGAGGERPDY